jgi:hypothetical protein
MHYFVKIHKTDGKLGKADPCSYSEMCLSWRKQWRYVFPESYGTPCICIWPRISLTCSVVGFTLTINKLLKKIYSEKTTNKQLTNPHYLRKFKSMKCPCKIFMEKINFTALHSKLFLNRDGYQNKFSEKLFEYNL